MLRSVATKHPFELQRTTFKEIPRFASE